MTQFKSHFWVTLAVVVLAFTVWIGNEASRGVPVPAQEPDRVLEIERYPDEPVQLVDLRIGTQSVKDHIKPKFKDPASKWATDRVTFKEKDDWFKRVRSPCVIRPTNLFLACMGFSSSNLLAFR